MRILFTGGGTGGHFYPIIAIADELRLLAKEQHLIPPQLFFMSPTPYNRRILFEHEITFVPASAGKVRRYFSIRNFFDLFKTGWGILQSIAKIFVIFPDVVVGKGGYASFPPLLAARFLRIPVIIHESDSEPGRVNRWAGKFAKRIAVSYPEAAEFFPKEKVAVTGQPLRRAIREKASRGAHEFLKFDPAIPTILILGGSLGAQIINEIIVQVLPELVAKYQIIHQTGKNNFGEIETITATILRDNPNCTRYALYDYLDDTALAMAAGAATIVISRGGSTIFEIAAWGVPSIIIPINEKVSHDQTKNAFNYARAGACVVIEEANLAPHLLTAEIDRLIADGARREEMSARASAFSHPNAAALIASEILSLALAHER